MEDLLNLATLVRSHYLEKLMLSWGEHQAAHSPSALEVLLELSRECPRAFKLYRVDMASQANSGAKLVEVNPDSHLSFTATRIEVTATLAVELHPFAWNAVDFRFDATPALEQLEAWTLHWLDVDDLKSPDADGLQGVIHSVTAPEQSGGFTTFSVDFGSAPVEALRDLLLMVSGTGARTVEICSLCLE